MLFYNVFEKKSRDSRNFSGIEAVNFYWVERQRWKQYPVLPKKAAKILEVVRFFDKKRRENLCNLFRLPAFLQMELTTSREVW